MSNNSLEFRIFIVRYVDENSLFKQLENN